MFTSWSVPARSFVHRSSLGNSLCTTMYWILSMEEQTPSGQQVIDQLLDRIKELTAENEDLKRRLTNVWGET